MFVNNRGKHAVQKYFTRRRDPRRHFGEWFRLFGCAAGYEEHARHEDEASFAFARRSTGRITSNEHAGDEYADAWSESFCQPDVANAGDGHGRQFGRHEYEYGSVGGCEW